MHVHLKTESQFFPKKMHKALEILYLVNMSTVSVLWQVVDFGEAGPVRCAECRAYMNPHMTFIEAGRRFVCCFCGSATQTPPDYIANVGPDGRRRDADERTELSKGSVEFVAPQQFMVGPFSLTSVSCNYSCPVIFIKFICSRIQSHRLAIQNLASSDSIANDVHKQLGRIAPAFRPGLQCCQPISS